MSSIPRLAFTNKYKIQTNSFRNEKTTEDCSQQQIIHYSGTETFVKKPKIAKLMRG